VPAVEMLDPPYDSIERAIPHQARNVPLRNAKLLVRGLGVAKCNGIRGAPSTYRGSKITRRCKAVEQKLVEVLRLSGVLPARSSEVSVSEVHLPEKSAAETTVLKQIHDAIDLICEDAARAELWAGALSAFAQPIPEYGSRNGVPSSPERP